MSPYTTWQNIPESLEKNTKKKKNVNEDIFSVTRFSKIYEQRKWENNKLFLKVKYSHSKKES